MNQNKPMTVEELRQDAIRIFTSACLFGEYSERKETVPHLIAAVRADQRAKADAVISATEQWVQAMDNWLVTGVPASPDETKEIYEQAVAAIAAVKETK